MNFFDWLKSLFEKHQSPPAQSTPQPIATPPPPKATAPQPKAIGPVPPPPVPSSDPFAVITAQYARSQIIKGQAELKNVVNKIIANRATYDIVAAATDFPWYLIASIHELEASLNFRTYLQNGDPLWDANGVGIKTTHVPKGEGPYPTWSAAAIAALGGPGAGKSFNWTVGQCLRWAENYNGTGYRARGIPSPYVWSYTDQYAKGKYVADGEFNSNAVSDQPGVAAIFKTLGIV